MDAALTTLATAGRRLRHMSVAAALASWVIAVAIVARLVGAELDPLVVATASLVGGLAIVIADHEHWTLVSVTTIAVSAVLLPVSAISAAWLLTLGLLCFCIPKVVTTTKQTVAQTESGACEPAELLPHDDSPLSHQRLDRTDFGVSIEGRTEVAGSETVHIIFLVPFAAEPTVEAECDAGDAEIDAVSPFGFRVRVRASLATTLHYSAFGPAVATRPTRSEAA